MNKLRIRKLGILSVAKMYAAIMLVVSLLISIPYGLIIMVFGAAMMGTGQRGGMAAGGLRRRSNHRHTAEKSAPAGALFCWGK